MTAVFVEQQTINVSCFLLLNFLRLKLSPSPSYSFILFRFNFLFLFLPVSLTFFFSLSLSSSIHWTSKESGREMSMMLLCSQFLVVNDWNPKSVPWKTRHTRPRNFSFFLCRRENILSVRRILRRTKHSRIWFINLKRDVSSLSLFLCTFPPTVQLRCIEFCFSLDFFFLPSLSLLLFCNSLSHSLSFSCM